MISINSISTVFTLIFAIFALISIFSTNTTRALDEKNAPNIFLANNFFEPFNEWYVDYFSTVTQDSSKLTKEFQEKILEWKTGEISNSSMLGVINDYLQEFESQLSEFNNTKVPEKFKTVKQYYTQSLVNEIKSYEFFKKYLLTNNNTNNYISTDSLSKSLELETLAFDEFTYQKKNEGVGIPIYYLSLNPDLNINSIHGFWFSNHYTIIGEIQNNGQYNITNKEIVANLYDSNDKLIGTTFAHTFPSIIMSKGQSSFKISIGPDDVSDFSKVKYINTTLH